MPGPRHPGAYGFRLVLQSPEDVLPGLPDAPPDADEVHMRWCQGAIEDDRMDVGEHHADIAVAGQVSIAVRRADRHVEIVLPEDPLPEAIVHPVATVPLAVLARWRGDATLHAGAVLRDGAAYAVCGGQGAGKSTTMALLAQRGLPVVTDDLLVVSGGEALAGPSCVDLRPDVAERFPDARFLGVVGRRERYRLLTAPAPARTPLGGLFLLGWHADGPARVEPLTLEERAQVIHVFDYAGSVGLPRGEALMDLLALPMWRLSRARDWQAADEALDLLLATAGDQ